MKTIYLDNASATPLRPEARSVLMEHLTHTYGNASSIHGVGRRAEAVLEGARHEVARALDVDPHEIIFTSGGTEANNLGIVGTARAYGARGTHILVSSIEHPSVLEAAESLTKHGFTVEHIPVDACGRIHTDAVLARVRSETILVSVMYANNEIGTIAPIRELSDALRARFPDERTRPLLHTDACQAVGQLTVAPKMLGVDLMTINSSKIYGPKGVGALYVRNGVRVTPQIVGGHQEASLRAGTENVPAIAGFARALTYATREMCDTHERLTALRDECIHNIMHVLPGTMLNGHPTERLPNNIHFSFPHIEGESLVLLLDAHGICTSTGSACSAHDLAPSHVLRAIGQDASIIHGSLRLTLGRETTAEDLRCVRDTLIASVKHLQALSPLPLSVCTRT